MLKVRIDDAMQTIASAMESRNNDTKSSAGDKFETGREMIQMEINNNEIQLNKAHILQQELSKIDLHKISEKIEPGSLVITNHENYFISVAMGKIMVDDQTYYAISLASPIGLLLSGKRKGDQVSFQNRTLEIQELY